MKNIIDFISDGLDGQLLICLNGETQRIEIFSSAGVELLSAPSGEPIKNAIVKLLIESGFKIEDTFHCKIESYLSGNYSKNPMFNLPSLFEPISYVEKWIKYI